MHLFSFDTETHLLRPGIAAPPMVCLQFSVDGAKAELVHARDPQARVILEWAFTHALVNGHNLAFDMAVICAWDPTLIPWVFQCYEADRATCTAVRMKLLDIALGWFEGRPGRTWGYSLADCALRLTDGTYPGTQAWANPVALDKTDPWRLRYGTLYGEPVESWPPEAKAYALTDAVTQDLVFRAQEVVSAAQGGAYLVDQFRQSRAAFWLRLMECRGIRTDPAQVEAFRHDTLVESEMDRAIATKAGLVRTDGTRDTKAAMARMVAVMDQLGEDIPLTEKGEDTQKEMAKARAGPVSTREVWDQAKAFVKLDEDSCLASGDDILLAYQKFGSLKTTISRVERLRMGTVLPLQASFQSIVDTGRTSCRMGDVADGESPPAWGFQLQNLPRKEGMRECFIPRAGVWGGAEVCPWCDTPHPGGPDLCYRGPTTHG